MPAHQGKQLPSVAEGSFRAEALARFRKVAEAAGKIDEYAAEPIGDSL